MSQTVNIQVPIDASVKNRALAAAKAIGFSSLQESIRLFLHQLASQELELTFRPKEIKLSAENEKRYAKMIADYEKDPSSYKSFTNVDDMMKYLRHDQDNPRL